MLMTGSAISEQYAIDRCYKVMILKGISRQPNEGFTCPNCGNDDPKTVDVVKRTCGYQSPLETPSDG